MDPFNIYLPVAGIQFNIILLIIIGFCVGILGGFFGVGGGWIVTPALNIFGFHISYAIGTGNANIFGQTIGAVKKHHKMGNIDWKLGFLSIITSVIGLEIGSDLIIDLEKIGDVGLIVRCTYIIFLVGLGSYMLYDYFVIRSRQLKILEAKANNSSIEIQKIERSKIAIKLYRLNLPPMISLPTSGIEGVSLWVILIIFLCTGFISGFLGVGGGFIIIPALVYLIGLPTVIAVGTSCMIVLFSSAYVCLTYAVTGRVAVIAALIMLIGASIGAQIGATAVKYIKGYGIRLLFAIMIILASFSVITEQLYKMTEKQYFQNLAGIVLMGTASTIALIILIRLIIESKKGKNKSNIIKKD